MACWPEMPLLEALGKPGRLTICPFTSAPSLEKQSTKGWRPPGPSDRTFAGLIQAVGLSVPYGHGCIATGNPA